jgi:hypothetical protein
MCEMSVMQNLGQVCIRSRLYFFRGNQGIGWNSILQFLDELVFNSTATGFIPDHADDQHFVIGSWSNTNTGAAQDFTSLVEGEQAINDIRRIPAKISLFIC